MAQRDQAASSSQHSLPQSYNPAESSGPASGSDAKASYYNFSLADHKNSPYGAKYQEHLEQKQNDARLQRQPSAALDVPTQRAYGATRMVRMLQVVFLIVSIPLVVKTFGWQTIAALQYLLAAIVISLVAVILLTLMELKPSSSRSSSASYQLVGDVVLGVLLLSAGSAAAAMLQDKTLLGLPCANAGYTNCKRAGGATGIAFGVFVGCLASIYIHGGLWNKQYERDSFAQVVAELVRGAEDTCVHVFSPSSSSGHRRHGTNGSIHPAPPEASGSGRTSPRMTRTPASDLGMGPPRGGEVREAPWLGGFLMVFRLVQIGCSCAVLGCIASIHHYAKLSSYIYALIVAVIVLGATALLFFVQGLRLWCNDKRAFGRAANKSYVWCNLLCDLVLGILVFTSASALAGVATSPDKRYIPIDSGSTIPVNRVGGGAYEEAATVFMFISFIAFCATALLSVAFFWDWKSIDSVLNIARRAERNVEVV